jgi:hypothetical protein
MSLEIVVPGSDRSLLSKELRLLTRCIQRARPELRPMFEGLGGGDGYGADFENAVFAMRLATEDPADCSCGAEDRNNSRYETWVAAGRSEADWTNEPCANTCAGNLPNFRHHASGFEVRWHKWIGRSMETTGECADVKAMIDECIRSLSNV